MSHAAQRQTCQKQVAIVQSRNDKRQIKQFSGLCGQKWTDPFNILKVKSTGACQINIVRGKVRLIVYGFPKVANSARKLI